MKWSSLCLLVGTLATTAHGQDQYLLNFDTIAPGQYIALDSVYPGEVWQVGPPQKVDFQQALSAPNVLVTDTLLPYPASGLWFAEFHMPVIAYGDGVMLEFAQRFSVPEGEARGWLEYFDPDQEEWFTGAQNSPWATGYIEYTGTGAMVTDTGIFYLGSSSDWTNEQYGFTCLALFGQENDRGGNDQMRFRFAFMASSNSSGNDGWMIDDVRLTDFGICSGVDEVDRPRIRAYPNPADRSLNITLDGPPGRPLGIELIGPTGQVVRRDGWSHTASRSLDVSGLAEGLYLLRATWGYDRASARIIVRH